MSLTEKQKKLYDYICERVEFSGVGPSYDEMTDFMGLSSKSGIHRIVKALRERGYVVQLKNRARAIMPCHMAKRQELVSVSDRTVVLQVNLIMRAYSAKKISGIEALQRINTVIDSAKLVKDLDQSFS